MASMEQTMEVETLEIADLEYDVGGMGAVEAADSNVSNEGFIVVMVVPR